MIVTPVGTLDSNTQVVPRVWWPGRVLRSFIDRWPACPEREYRPHERMCWSCARPKIVCECWRDK